ncbi:hypothetical protein DPMN_040875 [Dreissena polymorpha]|uniref:Uncharacterized protein n=1 Tax=Dreissena polymorpha TaxID=45954 RepID=A0A9D4CY10_DREPO|nr:hypothetical protein DPMN_040875 [Dreissena polymorpha]
MENIGFPDPIPNNDQDMPYFILGDIERSENVKRIQCFLGGRSNNLKYERS